MTVTETGQPPLVVVTRFATVGGALVCHGCDSIGRPNSNTDAYGDIAQAREAANSHAGTCRAVPHPSAAPAPWRALTWWRR